MRIIKVTGCHDCDNACIMDEYGDYVNNCERIGYRSVYDNIKAKTIHPDCPLDDWKEQGKNKISDAEVNAWNEAR